MTDSNKPTKVTFLDNYDYRNEKLFTRAEAAAFLGVKENTMAVWLVNGRYDLPIIKIGRLVRYRFADLVKFLNDCTQGGYYND